MRGVLTVRSEGRDRGSTFTCTIPLRVPEVPSDAAANGELQSVVVAPSATAASGSAQLTPLASPAAASGSLRAPRVLVAEDDSLCAALMQKILARLQVAGTIVSDGAAAVSAYKRGVAEDAEFDVILMDLQ